MTKAPEYRRNAAECRALAARMDLGAHRDQLLRMAATWEELASEREQRSGRDPDDAVADELPDELRRLDS
jgi:hypothetical protein